MRAIGTITIKKRISINFGILGHPRGGKKFRNQGTAGTSTVVKEGF